MIYAVNKETREHRVAPEWLSPDASFYLVDSKRWDVVQADVDGWIPWDGGECPLPDDNLAVVRHKDEEVIGGRKASSWRWDHWNSDGDIIAYRPILTENTKPEEPEWQCEGLPPVGIVCEYKHRASRDDGWNEVRVLGHFDDWVWVQLHDQAVPHSVRNETFDFRPIRTPEQRAEESAVDAMRIALHQSPSVQQGMQDLYTAIRDGKIPGVKLEQR